MWGSMIFIDANIYLDLYRNYTGHQLVGFLTEISSDLFIPKQVVDEVLRNRTNIFIDFLNNQAELPKTLNLPGIICQSDTDSRSIIEEIKKHNKVLQRMKVLYPITVEKVNKGIDEISIKLSNLFKNQVTPTIEEIERARNRKQFGNPPGKKGDPIGDEISWEQILSRIHTEESSLWIVTNDNDYTTKYNKKRYLNSFLMDELKGIDVRCFDSITDTIIEYKSSINEEITIPDKTVLKSLADDEAISKLNFQFEEKCEHVIEIIPNGIYDMYVCSKCHKVLQVFYSDDI